MTKTSSFYELNKKAKEIVNSFDYKNTSSLEEAKQKANLISKVELHEELLALYKAGDLKIWIFINGRGPLIPQGDYEIRDNYLHFLNAAKEEMQIPGRWPILFAIPKDGSMYIYQEEKWEVHK